MKCQSPLYFKENKMDGCNRPGMSREEWVMSGPPPVINYNHQSQMMPPMFSIPPPPVPVQYPELSTNFNDLVQLQLQKLNQPIPPMKNLEGSTPQHVTSFGPPKSNQDNSESDKYNPFVEESAEKEDDMDISDEDKESQKVGSGSRALKASDKGLAVPATSVQNSLEVKSGAAFYQGLILYIPPFEQVAHSYRGSPALKMLYASFEFSFKMPVKMETKPRENQPNMSDCTIYFNEHMICTGSGMAPHVEASVRALELLSETCYTIQAKEDYFPKCKLIDGENMKTLNLKKWEAICEKYPKIVEVTKNSHIQKTFAVFLDSHTSSGIYEDIVCCNLTRQDVNNIRSVVEFFHLTMLPCSISTNLSKKNTPCVVSIHKYTSAKKLLEILIECGGENDKFTLHPPDTFKEFYKLHPNYWDPKLRDKPENKVLENKTTLEDPILQASIMEPYENVISELFEKHKTLPKKESVKNDPILRKASDEFMKSTFQIDMAQSKNAAPVERMQLLLKYMEQLQEYGSRVLISGRADMIKIYHNAIDNVRKDLDECRKDIEKEQKDKEKAIVTKAKEITLSNSSSRLSTLRKKSPLRRRSKSPPRRRSKSPLRRRSKSPLRRRSKSPLRRRSKSPARRRSPLPGRRPRSKSPGRILDRNRRSPSPRRRPRPPFRRERSKSPGRPNRVSPPRRPRSPPRPLPPRRVSPQPSRSLSKEDDAFLSIFKDQFRRYMDILRRFRIEIEDTPVEHRGALRERLIILREQLGKFGIEVRENPRTLGEYQFELELCRDELNEQYHMINEKLVFHPMMGSAVPPPPGLYGPDGFNYPPF